MDDFLGTSIQFAERELKALEEEHASNLEKTVAELIASGFLDSDYESSSAGDLSDAESIDPNYNQQNKSQYIDIENYHINDTITDNKHINYNHIVYYVLLILFICFSLVLIWTNYTNQYILQNDYSTNPMHNNKQLHSIPNYNSTYESPWIDSQFAFLYCLINIWCEESKISRKLINDILSISYVSYNYKNIYVIDDQHFKMGTSLWIVSSLTLSDKIKNIK
eukprot:212324_1